LVLNSYCSARAIILYTLASNPILHKLIGLRKIGLGPLLMLPDIFMVVAAAILLYLSRQCPTAGALGVFHM
jgi:hypothetical protein